MECRSPVALIAAAGVVLCLGLGCATSQTVVVNPAAVDRQYSSAHLVAHGDPSSDVDASIQRELLLRGFSVSAGDESSRPGSAELIVRYVDDWKWDITMYLRRLDIQVYEADGGTLLASATWKNSPLHGYHGLDKIVSKLVREIFAELRVR